MQDIGGFNNALILQGDLFIDDCSNTTFFQGLQGKLIAVEGSPF